MAVSHFVAGAVFGQVGVSLFMAGAALGDFLNDSRGTECCKILVVTWKSNLGCGLTVSWSDHAQIMVGSWSDRPRIAIK